MGDWYRVVKTIKGHRYVYVQQTYREGGRVRTRNRYIGPAADGGGAGVTGAGSASGADNSPLAVTKTTLLQGAVSFGKAMVDQFDAGKWGATQQSSWDWQRLRRSHRRDGQK
jgi:hypothetical protein